MLILCGCAIQTPPTQLSTARTSIPTSNVTYTASPTPLLSPTSEETEVVLTGTSVMLPKEAFHFGATAQMSQVGGINGVYYLEDAPDETCAQNYRVFRFYDDGLVMSVPICDDDPTGDFLDNVWPDISVWFRRENNDSTDPRGIYHIAENKIWFTTVAEYVSHTAVIDYFGTFSKDQLMLSSFSHYNGHQTTEEEFIYLDFSNSP